MKQSAINDWLHSFKVYRVWVKMTWQRQLEYRFDTFAHSFGSIFWLTANFIIYYLVYQDINVIAGWTWSEMLLLYGVYNLWWGIMVSLFNGGLIMSEKVRFGKLDKFLLYPGKSIFYSTMKFEPQLIPHILAGAGLFIYALTKVEFSLNLINWLVFVFLVINSLGIAYFISVIFGSSAFWLTENQNIANFFWNWETLTKYPPSFFRQYGILYWAVYSIIPVAFIIALPSEVLLGKINLSAVGGALTVTLIFGLFARGLWRRGLKNYTGVSR